MMRKEEKRVPTVLDPDVVRAGIDFPYNAEAMTGKGSSKDKARRLYDRSGKETDSLRESAGWPSFTREKKPGSEGDRDNATPTSTDQDR